MVYIESMDGSGYWHESRERIDLRFPIKSVLGRDELRMRRGGVMSLKDSMDM